MSPVCFRQHVAFQVLRKDIPYRLHNALYPRCENFLGRSEMFPMRKRRGGPGGSGRPFGRRRHTSRSALRKDTHNTHRAVLSAT